MKTSLTSHQNLIHATIKNWVCDCCGSRFGTKHVLRNHMITHLPPSFACPKCPKKFVHAATLKNHLKRHAGILNQVCKFCSKGYSTKQTLTCHIVHQHFTKLHCEVPNCTFKSGGKRHLEEHLRRRKHFNQSTIDKLIKDLDKLKPDFEKMKYV